jgi:hypothetical protein
VTKENYSERTRHSGYIDILREMTDGVTGR